MFSIDELEKIRQLLEQLGPLRDPKDKGPDCNQKKKQGNKKPNQDQKQQNGNKPPTERCINLTPSQLLVIAGFIGGVLEVNSVLVDRNQDIEILLTGTLKRKTQLDKVMEQIGKMPFDQVMKSIMDSAED